MVKLFELLHPYSRVFFFFKQKLLLLLIFFFFYFFNFSYICIMNNHEDKMAEQPPPKVSNLMTYKHKKIITYFVSTKYTLFPLFRCY